MVLSTTRPVAAFDITVGGASAFEPSETLLQQGFAYATRVQTDGLHIVVYSLGGALLPEGETIVGTLSAAASGNIRVTRASMADKEARRIGVSLDQQTTGIEETEMEESQNPSDVFDLVGRKVKPQLLNSSSPQLRRGIYVKQGRKIIVK